MDGPDMGGSKREGMEHLQRHKQSRRRVEAHRQPTPDGRGPCNGNQLRCPEPADKRPGESEDSNLRDDSNGPKDPAQVGGEALAGPMQRTECVKHGMRRLNGAYGKQKDEKEAR